MKKVISFALIAVLLMNTMGYYAIFMGLQYRNNVAMISRINANQYDESQAVTLKIPMAIPYLADDTDFHFVDGTFKYGGQSYRLVKQKYVQETLIIVCIRDIEKQRIDQQISDYVMSFTDTGDDQDSHHITISFIKDFVPQTLEIVSTSDGWQSDVVESIAINNLIPSFTSSVIHPPERA